MFKNIEAFPGRKEETSNQAEKIKKFGPIFQEVLTRNKEATRRAIDEVAY